ncbi:MAG: pantetheine-phosphate adenylyltransferase [Candidatus Diapherotrites archaeon CG08_land_8_20_14_0_20_34_12]|nr:MAG: pantetheine-phosphate adenylyltransferase [Candidatus Diapherotrites archaeon CG08_land_8_20_14_0_20_34_12]
MKCVIYPGSFDPITFGHLDVIERASKIFDKVIVAIANNPEKKQLFSITERLNLAKESTANLKNVEIESFDGLLVDYLDKKGCFLVLRGLREMSDFQFEFQQAMTNRKLNKKIETIFVMTAEEYSYLSSSLVRELAKFNAPLSEFVPKSVESALRSKFKSK